jgi:hypothetical protein
VARRDSAIVISTGAIRRVLLVIVVIVILVVAGIFGRALLQRAPGLADQIDRNAYQAVFLTGGQVFFGKAAVSDDAVALSDVFYLAPNTDSSQPQQVGQLLKRGSELHGPRDPMLIARAQVLFIENMRDDSQVIAAIKRFKSGEQPAVTTTPEPATQAATTPSGTPRPSASR